MNHDRKKEKELTGDALAAQERASKEKGEKYALLHRQFVEKNRGKIYDAEGLAASGLIIDINPENYTCWNYRRRYLLAFFKDNAEEAVQKLLRGELEFTQKAIQRNPKSYWVWKYRRELGEWLDERNGKTDWRREIDLCGKLLKLDSRNFHCWSYRRFVAAKAHSTLAEELQFATQKIEENFSNYSAWHQRSALLLALYPTPEELKAAAKKELELIHSAFFTDPNDQSCWIYLRWLLTVVAFDRETLEGELKLVEELLSLEPNSKWPLLTTVELLRRLRPADPLISSRLTLLLSVDPLRATFYRHLASVAAAC